MNGINYILKLLNIKQWVKNLLILVPAVFATSSFTADLIVELVIAFFSFSLIASAVYLFNDLMDKKEDSIHPTKKHRLIASNQISTKSAIIFLFIFLISGLAGEIYLGINTFLFAIFYIIINIIYSVLLKRIPLLDIIILLSGYTIRLFIGGVLADVPLTSWIFLMIIVIAIYLILFKRYSDILLNKNDFKTRFYQKLPIKNLLTTLAFLINIIYISYIIYVYKDSHYFIFALISIPITGFAQYRYHKSMNSNPHQEPLSILHKDFVFSGTLFIWTVLMLLSLYL